MSSDPTVVVDGPKPLRQLAQYELLNLVGSGSMGQVYLGRDTDLDRRVAIKLLHTGPGHDVTPAKIERFLREARTAAQLVHPNVAIVYQIGRENGLTFIVMEWLEGMDLSRWVDSRGPMPWRDALFAIGDAAAGLSAAHAAGLVHRDIKPSNLMRMPTGQVKVVDFGLARWHGMASELTVAGGVMGTPAYLSPEQCSGEEATPASDIYALGCTLYNLLTGRLPFDAANMATLLYLQVTAPMPDPRVLAPETPDAVAAIVERACAKQAHQRYGSAMELLDDLRAALEERALPSAAAPAPSIHALSTLIRPDASALLRGTRAVETPRPPPPPREPQGNLPSDATSFVGRDELVARTLEQLASTRLLTLTGPGGTGKTRLSLQAARQAETGLADGAWFVELATVPAGGEIDSAMAAALGVPETAGRALSASIVEHLRKRQALVVLDNCEQVIDSAAATVARLLAAAPQLQLIATSRQALGVPGEAILQVPPMSLAEDGRDARALMASESGQLFVARARAVRADFAISEENAEAVAEICRRLDGIPLAIELAAARVKLLAPAQIASRLSDVFKLLTGGQRTLLPRQQTLRALIDWSYDLLVARDREVFNRMAVFNGSFDLEAAEAVLPDAALPVDEVIEGLTELVDRSLVIASERSGVMRYHLLGTMQQYAAEHLGGGEPLAALQRRHAAHYTERVEAQVQRLNGAHHAEAVALLNREADNARAALDALIALGDVGPGVRLAAVLATYWLSINVASEGVARIEKLLALDPPASAALALLQQRCAMLELYLGRRAAARSWLERGLAIARTLEDGALECGLLRGLGNVAYRESKMDTATEHYLGSMAAARKVGDRTAEAMALNNLAAVAGEQRLYSVGRGYLQRALQIHRELGRTRNEAESLRNLALIEHDLGNAAEAQGYFDACVRIHQAMNDEWGTAYTLWQMGECKLHSGDVGGAHATLQQALDRTRSFDDRRMVGHLLDLLAVAAGLDGQPGAAAEFARRSLAMRKASENPEDVAFSLVTYANLCLARDPARSARMLGCATALRERRGTQLPARQQDKVDAASANVLAALADKKLFARLFDEGRQMDPETLLAAL